MQTGPTACTDAFLRLREQAAAQPARRIDAGRPVWIFGAGHFGRALARAMQAPALQQRFASMAVDITPSTPARFVQLMEADTARWARVIQDAKIKAD